MLRKFPNKKNALIFDFKDNVRYLRGQVRERQEIYEREPKFKILYKDFRRSLLMYKNKNEQRNMSSLEYGILTFGTLLLFIGFVIDVIDNNKNK